MMPISGPPFDRRKPTSCGEPILIVKGGGDGCGGSVGWVGRAVVAVTDAERRAGPGRSDMPVVRLL
jgi:hypothetical protein